MTVTYRPMRPRDVRECVSVVATHPVLGPRYVDVLSELRTVWLGLLGREAFRSVVFEDTHESRTKIIGAGVTVFVSDEFVRSLKRPPLSWIGPELTRRISRGESPLLSDRALRKANAQGGLNLVIWEGPVRAELCERTDVTAAVTSAFMEQHHGFLLKEAIGQPPTREILEITLRSGTQLLCEDGRYADLGNRSVDEVFGRPYYLGLTREVALSRVGAWLSSLFVYQAPHCNFRPSEQRLLLAALRGGTDRQLSDELGISLSAVKKTWLSIYDRASRHLPSLLPNRSATADEHDRGREKKQRFIAYLRDHLEELRPASP